MIEIDDKVFRNMQEQVQKNKEDIEQFKNGIVISYSVGEVADLVPLMTDANVGKYIYVRTPKKLYVITRRANEGLLAESLGSYPAVGPTGETGATGPTGPTGQTGPGIYGCFSNIAYVDPADYKIGDFVVLFNGNLYKNINNQWVLQTCLRGPQGIQGQSGSVSANPEGTVTGGNLTKIEIDGVIYTVCLDSSAIAWVNAIKSHVVQNGNTTELGGPIEVDGLATFNTGIDSEEVKTGLLELTGNLKDANGNTVASTALTGTVSWASALTSKLYYDQAYNEIFCTEHFYSTGDIETTSDLVVGRDLIVDAISNIQDPDGNEIITQALAQKEDKGTFSLISDETTTEDVSTYTKNFGTQYRAVYVQIIVPQSSPAVNSFLRLKANGYYMCSISINNNSYQNIVNILCENKFGRIFTVCSKSVYLPQNSTTVETMPNGIGQQTGNITKIDLLILSSQVPAGTNIKIYGVQ